jgi:hypothetical protein
MLSRPPNGIPQAAVMGHPGPRHISRSRLYRAGLYNLNMINLRFLGKSPRITIGPSFSRVGRRAAGINSRAVRAGLLGARLNPERDDVEAVIRAVVSRTGWCLPCCAAEDLNEKADPLVIEARSRIASSMDARRSGSS